MTIALYPGSFDPVTMGHLDVTQRARRLFDKVIVGVAQNSNKQLIFTPEERCAMIVENVKNWKNVEVISFQDLTVDIAKRKNAHVIIRGLRAVSDFEYEFQLAQMNRHMESEIETLFLMPNQEYFYTSSKLIKAVSEFQSERVAKFVPANVLEALKKKFSGNHKVAACRELFS